MARHQAYCNVHYGNMRKKEMVCKENRCKYILKNTGQNGDKEKI